MVEHSYRCDDVELMVLEGQQITLSLSSRMRAKLLDWGYLVDQSVSRLMRVASSRSARDMHEGRTERRAELWHQSQLPRMAHFDPCGLAES